MSIPRIHPALAVVAAALMFAAPQLSAARGYGASPPQGCGPGAGYDSRRNRDVSGLGYPWAQLREREDFPRRERVADPARTPGWEGRGTPAWRDPVTGYLVPRRGYGAGPGGWRGAGPSAYPRHRQYGYPPGLPR